MKREGKDTQAKNTDFLTCANPLVVAAHELKTPLVLMRQLSLEFSDELKYQEEQLAESVNLIEANNIAKKIRLTSEKSLRLMDSLTRAARLEDGLFELEPMRLDNIIREVSDEISPLAHTLGQNIRIKYSRKIPPVIASRELLRALVLNLLDNSIQYNNRGEDIEISVRADNNFAKLEIRDFGAKIELAEFRKLRDKLGHAQPVSSRPLSSGLGLVIADAFAKKMSGRLDVKRPQRGGGLAFQLTLPITRQMNLLELI